MFDSRRWRNQSRSNTRTCWMPTSRPRVKRSWPWSCTSTANRDRRTRRPTPTPGHWPSARPSPRAHVSRVTGWGGSSRTLPYPLYPRPSVSAQDCLSWLYFTTVHLDCIPLLYLMTVSHDCISWLYRTTVSHDCISRLYLMTVSLDCISWLYLTTVSHDSTSWLYFMTVSRDWTSWLYLNTVSHDCISWLYLFIIHVYFLLSYCG